jgi:outer membrane lipoprotein carrier protein
VIASAPDLKALQADFVLTSAPDKDGLEWVLASPKTKDGLLQSVRVGFQGAELSVLEIVDSFGQRSVMRFSNLRVNAPLDAGAFQFKPPAGADVIQQ